MIKIEVMKTMIQKWTTGSLLMLAVLFGGSQLHAQGIEPKCEQKWGTDSVKTIENISVYREYFKQKNYDAAYQAWLAVFGDAPCAREQTHVDGVAMYKHFISIEKDAARKKALIDTLFMIYEVRAANFEKSAGNAIGRLGVDMLSYRPEPNTDVLNTFARSVELGGNSTEFFVISYYFKVALKEFASGKLSKEQILDIYDKLTKIVDYNINEGNNADKFAESKQSIDADLAGNIIKDCDEIIALFGDKYRNDPANKDLRDLIFSLLLSKGCSDKDLFIDVAVAKYKETPNARLAHVLARRFQQNDNINRAAEYYQKAIQEAENDSIKAQYNYDFATLYSSNKQFARARQLAQEAARLMPNWGKPIMFIGDLYAASYNQCGSGIEAQSVYWAAVDKYQRARAIDPSMAEEALAKITKYAAYFPSTENLFFSNISKGSSYAVGCWIGESTTVRSSD